MGKLGILLVIWLVMSIAIGAIGCAGETAATKTPTPTSCDFGLNSGNGNANQAASVLNAQRFQMSGTATPVVAKAPLPVGAADASSAIWDGLLYVIGGVSPDTPRVLMNNCQVYNPGNDSWWQGAPMPTPRFGPAAAVVTMDNKPYIYVFGGIVTTPGNAATNICERYDITNNMWASSATGELTPIPATNGIGLGIMCIANHNKIYIFCGEVVLEFDPTGNGGRGSYTQKGIPADPYYQKGWATMGLVTVNGEERIYIIGGGSYAEGNYVASNYYYLPSDDTWHGPLAPAPFAAHGQIRENPVYNNKIYYALGQGGVFFPYICYYDPVTDKWSSIIANVPPGHERDGVVGGFIGDTLYMVGGRNVTPAIGLTYNDTMQTPTELTLTQISVLLAGSPSGNVRLGLYADNASGRPGNLIVDAGAAAAVNGWVSIGNLTAVVNLGVYYWLAFDLSSQGQVQYQTGGQTRSHYYYSYTYGTLPTVWGNWNSFDSTRYVMRATLTCAPTPTSRAGLITH